MHVHSLELHLFPVQKEALVFIEFCLADSSHGLINVDDLSVEDDLSYKSI